MKDIPLRRSNTREMETRELDLQPKGPGNQLVAREKMEIETTAKDNGGRAECSIWTFVSLIASDNPRFFWDGYNLVIQ